MKKRLWFFLSVVAASVTGAGAGWHAYPALAARHAAPRATAQPAVQTVDGETVVTVSPAAQRASHLAVSPLARVTVEPARTADATVIDLQPYFDLVGRLAAARANADTSAAEAGNAHAQYARSRALFDDDRNVSRKTLQDADTTMQTSDAKRRAAHATLDTLDATLRAQFGDALADAATHPASALLRHLQTGHAAVLRVTLPAGAAADAPPTLTVDAPDGRTVVAQRLSASPAVDPAVQGVPWLYASARALPAGMRTRAHVPTTQAPAASLVIPSRAVLWYGGATWVYVKIAPDQFARRFVRAGSASLDDARGIVVTDGFHAGDEVVTQGAQLLLSEELKPQGIATACKDPPECDD